MSISKPDQIKLWSLAAGFCSYPSCKTNCIHMINTGDHTLIGEMAHLIARKPNGPRGKPTGGKDAYSNLILLCPTHHRLIDKAPKNSFPITKLKTWKRKHEARMRGLLKSHIFGNRKLLLSKIHSLLTENHDIWKSCGPESKIAKSSPLSNVAALWELEKNAKILPNNKLILELLRNHNRMFSTKEQEIISKFRIHATALEHSASHVLDQTPRFPKDFERMVRGVRSKTTK